MQRILIIGSPGAGKSTLSHRLAAHFDLPLHHLDRLFWLPGWVERDRAEGRAELAGILAQDSWIIDGNYGSTLPMRLARADTVIWLDYPTLLCLNRAIRRWWRYRGITRPDMTEGCPERFDLEFMLYIANFRRAWRHRNADALRGFRGTVIRLGSPAETAAWLGTVERAA
ncbi:MAG: topology modulation protein [Sphingomonadaceae bacterium]|nr:topology modulation protein [Sphingomonadaceae bacterium]